MNMDIIMPLRKCHREEEEEKKSRSAVWSSSVFYYCYTQKMKHSRFLANEEHVYEYTSDPRSVEH